MSFFSKVNGKFPSLTVLKILLKMVSAKSYYHSDVRLPKPTDSVALAVGILIVILNMVEVRFIGKTSKKKLHKSQIYLLNLALSDIMIGLAIILLISVWEYMGTKQTNTQFLFALESGLYPSRYVVLM